MCVALSPRSKLKFKTSVWCFVRCNVITYFIIFVSNSYFQFTSQFRFYFFFWQGGHILAIFTDILKQLPLKANFRQEIEVFWLRLVWLTQGITWTLIVTISLFQILSHASNQGNRTDHKVARVDNLIEWHFDIFALFSFNFLK